MLFPGIEDLQQLFPHFWIPAHAVEFRIRFQHVQERVHCPLRHDPVFRELLIALRRKVRMKGFQVAARIPAFVLNEMEEFPRLFKRRRLSARERIVGERIDGKRLVIGVLGGIQNRAVRMHGPEDTAVLAVRHLQQRLIRVRRIREERWIRQGHGGLREEIQNPAVQNAASLCRGIPLQVIPDIPHIPSVDVIPKTLPERKNSVFQMISGFSD